MLTILPQSLIEKNNIKEGKSKIINNQKIFLNLLKILLCSVVRDNLFFKLVLNSKIDSGKKPMNKIKIYLKQLQK